jgi:bleomycin hydrolase
MNTVFTRTESSAPRTLGPKEGEGGKRIGVDVLDGQTRRWRVENSWGSDCGKDGFFR